MSEMRRNFSAAQVLEGAGPSLYTSENVMMRYDVPGREMIEIKMEMVPFGHEDARYQIALIRIVNDATSKNSEVGHYDVTIFYGHDETKLRIEGFPRRLQIFDLLEEILSMYKEVWRGECQS